MIVPSRVRLAWIAVVVGALAALGVAAVAHASDAGSTGGPSVTLDRDEINPGGVVTISISGFTATNVTISVCGNEARRGSSDCNMPASEGLRLQDGIGLDRLPIAVPPTTCPCVIRVSTQTNDEIAVAPIVITGHPVGPLVDGPTLDDPVAVSLVAEPSAHDWWEQIRPSLGGPVSYDVTLSVRNRTTVPLRQVVAFGSAGRSATDQLLTLDFPAPGVIAAGQTWRATLHVTIPAPSLGTIRWRASVSGAGPTVKVTATSRQRTLGLMLALMLIVVAVFTLAMRAAIRRHIRRAARRRAELDEGPDVDTAAEDVADAPTTELAATAQG